MILLELGDQTDPTGLCFISYRRARLEEIRLLVATLHEHGIPTWQDLKNLDEEPLEPGLRAALTDPQTASGLLWITPDIADSPIITGVEIPGLINRAERQDGFYLIPVAAGGLDYAAAAQAATAVTTLNDFAAWNVLRLGRDPLVDEDALVIARRVLARRVAAVHAALAPSAPFNIDIYTRTPAIKHPDAALTVDLTHRFDGRIAKVDAWQQRVMPALEAIVEAVATRAPGRAMEFRGLIGLPAATALGATLLAPRGLTASWMQYTPGAPAEPYTLTADRKDCGFTVGLHDGRPSGADLGISVNVSGTTIPAIQVTPDLPDFRAWVQADPPGNHPHMFSEAGEALDLAYRIIEEVRTARARYGCIGDLHLFVAGPVGLAFLLGQLLNTLGCVHTYEHVSDTATGHYRAAVSLRPAG